LSVLTVIQTAARELGLVPPSTVVANTGDIVAQQLLAFMNRAGQLMRSEVNWPKLEKEYTFTLTTSTASYAMPADFERFVYSTFWDRDSSWEMQGPIDAHEWQLIKSGVPTPAIYRRWRFKGLSTLQFFLADTPTSADNGTTLVFEYYTRNWIRPKTWAVTLVFAASTYCFYNGNYYYTSAGGTAGAGGTVVPPTHTSGTTADGASGIAWTYFADPYEKATADTDELNLDEQLIILDIKWRYRQAKGLDGWELMKADRDVALERFANFNRGAGPISLNAQRIVGSLPYPLSQDTDYG